MGKYSDYYFQQNQIDINIAVFIAKKTQIRVTTYTKGIINTIVMILQHYPK